MKRNLVVVAIALTLGLIVTERYFLNTDLLHQKILTLDMQPTPHEQKWWKEAVIYEIYPASFSDSNGDGFGDIPGIISKLDYLQALGINVLHLCPHYPSPQIDMGYDISNYENVHEPYGTVEDVETLINATHARGMKIILI
jgi:alpha-glucosidase/glucan 1,6-alpha-glucosidase